MIKSIGRYAGRACLRPGFVQVHSVSHSLTRGLKQRSYEDSQLDLPALDLKWRQVWQERTVRKWEKLREELQIQLEKMRRGEIGEMDGLEENTKQKMYILPMFPYPSGDLHLGHLRVYTISDTLSRFRRMQGFEVIHPIGFDAFGLPAENAAIERGIDPATWTRTNIAKMMGQLLAMNGQWDLERNFATCDPNFYKHTQRLFLLLHQRGLAYQANSMVNYDPVDKTVLANEQVDANGCSWRSGAIVEKRLLKQWFFKISEFREDLLEGLKSLEGAWPERVLAMQKNWLGKSTGARIKFPIMAYAHGTHASIEVFTTRPDTVFGVQYIALASTHPLVRELAKTDIELQAFLDTMPALPPDAKVGYLLPNVRAVNPLAYEESTPDATKASIPIYVAPYVLGDYGDGAVMGVPGHDTRDHAFWKHNRYDEPIRMVVASSPDGSTGAMKNEPFIQHGHLTSHSGPYSGLTTAEATSRIIDLLKSKDLGSSAETWRLRDWLISRQRYWGTPIPIIHCDSCGPVPVPEHQLPVKLPSVEGHWMKGKGGNPLDDAHDWINTPCPKCHAPAKRDTDTMDTFVDSSWYFMRFIDAHNEDMLFSPEEADNLLPVDLYIGGVEHAILHLLYARFISKFIATTSLWNSKNGGEPFKQLLAQGMVHGITYSDPSNGRFLKPNEVDLSDPSKPIVVATGASANVSFEKMSKSKYNGVDPMTCISKYGADATRAHMLFQAPVSEVLEWDEEKISGITRWLRRIYDHIEQMSPLWQLRTSILYNDEVHPYNPKTYFLSGAEMYEQLKEYTSLAGKDPHPLPELLKDKIEDPGNFTKRFESEMKLWRTVQSTLMSVTESYSKTYSLNTVVSDLMTLTNVIIEQPQLCAENEKIVSAQLNKSATMALIQMMAPITPAFADECWSLLHPAPRTWLERLVDHTPGSWLARLLLPSKNEQMKPADSIFDHPFPEPDGTFEMLAPQTQTCAVQVQGKLKFAVGIPIPKDSLKGEDLEKWVVKEILDTEEGKSKLTGKMDVTKARKVIVVRGGKTVNFVL